MSPETDVADSPGLRAHALLFNPTAKGVPGAFPFPIVGTFDPLMEAFWERADSEPEEYGEARRKVEGLLAQYPGLNRSVKHADVAGQHGALVERIIELVAPGLVPSNELRGLVAPLGGAMLLPSKRVLEQILPGRGPDEWAGMLASSTRYSRMLYAYKAVLKQFYDKEMELDQPVILVVPSADDATDRYMKVNASTQYISVRAVGPIPQLSDDDLDDLLRHVDDMGAWMEKIPPDRFEFAGVSVMTFTDVTNEVATAVLKEILLASDANLTEENFELVQREVRTLFRRPNLTLGLASVQADGALNFSSDRKIWNSLRIRDAVRGGHLSLEDTVHATVLEKGAVVVIDDLAEGGAEASGLECVLEGGVRSILIAPLRYGGTVVGLLELSSPQSGDLQALATLKLKQIESVFALAVHQNLERFESRVDSITQSTYTAIHPSVSWRFRDAAIAMLERGKVGDTGDAEPIVFEGLYPLYASADIKSSSYHRSKAIRADLVRHLRSALATCQSIQRQIPMTLLEELSHRIGTFIERDQRDWGPGDESAAATLIRKEINPLFSVLESDHPGLSGLGAYRQEMGLGDTVTSRQREAYERSLARINDSISHLLDRDQAELQTVFPHYFEKHQTDGVEHTIYIGSSLVRGRTFDRSYLHNLRLRQLITSCEIARKIEGMKPELPIPLEITQLLLVQDQPLTIRFRLDEKKFDVDGADSVRYEIIKKRIDKARLRNSDERIAQPDRIAVVYSAEQEAAEYLRYFEFLRARGLLKDDVEQVELEDLPGASRLRALRVSVDLETAARRQPSQHVWAEAQKVAHG